MAPQLLEYRSGARQTWINRRGPAAVAGVIIWLAMVFGYAGAAWAMAAYRLIVDGGVLLLWVGAAWGIGAWLFPLFRAEQAEADRRTLLAWATATGLGVGILGLVVLGLGLAGWLNQAVAVAMLAIGLALGIAKLARTPNRGHALRGWLSERAGWNWLGLIAAPFAAVMTVGAMLPPYLLWTPQEPHGYDVVEYHLQVPREWYEAGRIIPLHHNVFSFFPFNVEMHYLFAMHLRGGPWAGMYLAQFMHGAFIALTVLAVCGLAGLWRRQAPPIVDYLGGSKPGATSSNRGRTTVLDYAHRGPSKVGGKLSAPTAGLLAFLALATTPWMAQLGAIAYDEGGFLLFGTLSIGWAMRSLRSRERRIGRLVLAGVMAGLACGAKLTAVPEVLVAVFVVSAVLLFVPRIARGQPLLARMGAVVAFGLAGTMVFAPWLVRTWAWSGNPVFPELPALGHGDFAPVQVQRWKRAHAAQPDQRSISARLDAGWWQVLANWQFGFLLVPAALLAIVIGRHDPDTWFLGAMLFLLAVFWLGFTHLQGRFFILAVPICALLVARLSWPAIPLLIAQAGIAIVLLNLHFLTPARRQAMPIVLGTEDLSWLTPPALQSVPKDAPLALIGDAKAFLYQVPMTRLTYRTVFDANTSMGRGLIQAWAGAPPKSGSRWLLIDPNELERFEKYYQPFPPVPPRIAAHHEPYAKRGTEARRHGGTKERKRTGG